MGFVELLAVGIVAGGLVGWLIGNFVKGRPIAGLVWGLVLGPPGWLVLLMLYPGAIPCPHCGRKTPWAAAPETPPGAGHPHLRCRRCRGLIG
jgi:hypothetical protein